MNKSIAYIAAEFPKLSETFVYREVRALRMRGWFVNCVSLNEPAVRGQMQFNDLESNLIVVYRSCTLKNAALELARHPLRALRTVFTAFRDGLFPGDRLRLMDRLKLPIQVLYALGLARKLRRQRIQHVHCHFAHAPTTVGMYAAKQLNVPFSFTGHANDIFQRRSLLKRKIQRATFVNCISHWHREFYQSIVPAAQTKLKNVRCGVDVNGWSEKDRRLKPAASPSGLRVLTICRLVYKKGVDTLIRALSELENREWKLTVAGDGPDARNLKALAGMLGCSDRVRWLGSIDNDRVPKLLAESDVFALPCRTDASGDRDGIPVVLMEAMACRVPVISGDLPAIRELVEDGASGFLVGGEDVKSLTARLDQIAQDKPLRARLAEAGRARVEEEFSLDRNISRLEDALSKA